jgi:outer membrane cobalamin receptor
MVRDGGRALGQQAELRHVLQSEALGGRFPAAVSTRRRLLGQSVRQRRQRHQVADFLRAIRRVVRRSVAGLESGELTYFDNSYEDQIAFRSGVAGDGIPEFVNIDGSEAHGWELEAALQRRFLGFSAVGNYSFVDATVVTNQSTSQQFQPGQPLLRRPQNSGSLRVAYTRTRVTVDVNARWVGDRHDNSFLSLRTVPNAERPAAITTDITVNPGYNLVGLGVSIEAHRTLSVFLRIENLGDTVWDSALGYPGLPRAAVVGARFNVTAR